MIDDLVLLAPLATLVVVLLLGFAGCEFEGRVGPPQPDPPPPPTLTLRARVPTAVTVIRVLFAWQSPSTPRTGAEVTTPSGTDGADNLFDLVLPAPASEAWSVRCEVQVQGGATPAPFANGMFTLDGSLNNPIATFQATGGASDLAVVFVNVT